MALSFLYSVHRELGALITDGAGDNEARHQALDARMIALERSFANVAQTRSMTRAAASAAKKAIHKKVADAKETITAPSTASTSKPVPVPIAKVPQSADSSDDEIPLPQLDPVPAYAKKKTSTSRCKTCHGRGHEALECKTADPTAMRKRVASNRRKEKATGKSLPDYLYRPPPPMPAPPWQVNAYHTAAPDPQAYAAIAADAHELRRRHQQSVRDKRRARRSAKPTTS
jgi:hypothetical protein